MGLLKKVGEYVSQQKNVQNPIHYQGKGMEALDVIEAFDLNFNLGNAIKYIIRCEHKGSKSEDLEKAIFYLNRELNNSVLTEL